MLACKIGFFSRKVEVLSSFTFLLTSRYLLVLVQNHLQGREERSDDPACDYGYHRRWCWWYCDGHVQLHGSCIWWNKLSANLESQFPFLWNIHVRIYCYYAINKLYLLLSRKLYRMRVLCECAVYSKVEFEFMWNKPKKKLYFYEL